MKNINNDTMNNNDNNNDNTINSSSTVTAAIMDTPAHTRQPGNLSVLYKLAARNLREYHCVPSMTALKLEKTVALLGLPPRRVVEQGLAPRRLLKVDSSPLVLVDESSGGAVEEVREIETGNLVGANTDILTSNSSEEEEEEEEEEVGRGGGEEEEEGVGEDEEEEEEDDEEEVGQDYRLFSDDSDSIDEGVINSINNSHIDEAKGDVEVLEVDGCGLSKRPVHTALVAGGINIHPSETRHLLRVLGVSPHRLVRLGLLEREAVRDRREGGPCQRQLLRAGGPRKGGVGRRYGPPHGPHGIGRSSSDCGLSRPIHAPPCQFDGDGHHTMHLGEKGEEEGMPAPLDPHGGPGHRGPHHQGGCLQGPSHGPGQHSMPTVRHGPKHGHGHHSGGLLSESEGGEGKRPPKPEQHGPRRRYGGGMGRSRGRPHGLFRGPFREGGASCTPLGVTGHPRHGSPSRGGGSMKQRSGRHGGTQFCSGGVSLTASAML